MEKSKVEQCIVFVNTQPKAEETAQLIARDLPELPETENMIEELDAIVESTSSTVKLKKFLQNFYVKGGVSLT